MTTRLASVWTLAHWPLPGNALVEFLLRHWLGLRFVLAHVGALHLPERRRTGGHQAWWRCRLAQMGQDLAISAARRSISSRGVSIRLTLPPGPGLMLS